MIEHDNIIRGIPSPIPGVDTDNLIMEQILGWKKIGESWFSDHEVPDYRIQMSRRRFSENLSDAFWLADYCDIFIVGKYNKGWYCDLRIEGCAESTHVTASTPEFAICLAILRQPYSHPEYIARRGGEG